MSDELILVEQLENNIKQVVLNDPQRRNAMSEEMAELFVETVTKLKKDKNLRAVILTGAGKAFSGGGNLEMLFNKTKLSKSKNKKLMEKFYNQFLSIASLDVPVIAAINGHAIGAGLCVTLACDIRIASSQAKLGLNFVRLGLHPGMGATYYLPRIVGQAVSAELLYCGKIITAEEAVNIGLINKVVSSENFENTVMEAANNIATSGPQSIRELKKSLRNSSQDDLQTCLKREAEFQSLDYVGEEFLEGINAAREKRAAKF